MASKSSSKTLYPSGYDSTHYSYASVNSSYPLSNPVGKSSSNTSYAQINLKTGSSAETYVFYTFDCSSIPSDATIDSVTCSAKGYVSQTNANRVATRQMQMYYGTSTAKGSAYTLSTSTSATNLTVGSWTRSELNDIRIRLYCKRGSNNTTTTYYMRFYGATLTINYTYQYESYTITTSVSGGTATPTSVDVDPDINSYEFVLRGNTSREPLTSLTYNGANVLSSAVRMPPLDGIDSESLYSVTLKSPSASYGFVKNSSGYYESDNKGQGGSVFSQGSYARCTVNFNLPYKCEVVFYVINYAQQGSDYGLLSNIDQSFANSTSADSTRYWVGNTADKNIPDEQAVVYEMESGSHTIDVKFIKNYGTNSYNDSIQFRIVITPMIEPLKSDFYYTYTVQNPSDDGSLVAVFGSPIVAPSIFYVKTNGKWTKYTRAFKKVNGAWVEQSNLLNVFESNKNYVKG